jgi:hypothetical protein
LHREQVQCERYDAKALFKKWDRVYITMTASCIAYGSTEDKAVSRALGSSAADAHMVMPTAGCVSAAVVHDDKMNVLHLSFPATPNVPDQYFAFATSDMRDLFKRALQARSNTPAATSASVSNAASAQAKDAIGGTVSKVNTPCLQPCA